MVHAREGHQDAALPGDGSARESRAGATAHEWHIEFTNDAHDFGHLPSIARENHQVGEMLRHAAVVFIESQILGTVEVATRAHEVRQTPHATGGSMNPV